MLAFNISIPLFRMRAVVSESLMRSHFKYYNKKINTVAKRGSILEEMIANKDKRKNWDFNIMPSKPKVRTFDKIHKPHRRRAVLNSLFIRNITDVISTGETVPEIANFKIEITGVQISPCFKTLNVFWQVPTSLFDSCEDIGQLLNIAAPKIRAELISRNVIGKVPFIFFLRDCTNARVAAFEQAMQKLDMEPKPESCAVVDDSFTKDIYSFKKSKVDSTIKPPEPVKDEIEKDLTVPKNPMDMKCNVFGLDHDIMMERIVALKKKRKNPPQNSAIISPENLTDEDDLFSKIPGVCFNANSSKEANLSREAIFKKFHIERKMLMKKSKNIDDTDNYECYEDNIEEGNDIELNPFDDDFIEDETVDK